MRPTPTPPHPPARLALAALAAAAATAAVHAPSALADEAVTTTATSLDLRADAGRVAWLRPDGAGHHRFVSAAVRGPAPQDVGPRLAGTPRFDVGRGNGNAATIVWADGCALSTGRCSVRALPAAGTAATRPRVLTRIPYAGGGAPEVALDGARLVYTRVVRRGRQACDTVNVRTLTGSATPARPRRLTLGTGCVPVLQLDVEGRWVAALVVPNDQTQTNSQPTEVRSVRVDGSGRGRRLQLETQGEESNYVDAIALDGGRVYTARAGFRQANVFSRIDPASGARSQARVFGTLAGGFARDRGRPFFVQGAAAYGEDGCAALDDEPCLLVAGQDPWAGSRRLLPQLTMAAAPAPLFLDDALTLSGAVTRRTATRTARGAAMPQAGVALGLATATLDADGRGDFVPSGTTTTTGADGRYAFTVPAAQVPGRGYDVRPAAPGTLGDDAVFPVVYAHLTVTSAARTGDRVTVSGTISPAQPGRRVVLQRRLRRDCGRPGTIAGGGAGPSTAATPKGCVDQFRALGSAGVSADGASFTITRTAAAGSFFVNLDAPRAGQVAGETEQVPVT